MEQATVVVLNAKRAPANNQTMIRVITKTGGEDIVKVSMLNYLINSGYVVCEA